MSTVPLEFPVHVRTVQRDGRRHFAVRPLMAGGPEGVAVRFDRAVQKCTEQIREQFKLEEIARAGAEELLWFRFNPEVESKIYQVGVKTGGGTLAGPLHAAWFDHAGERYVVLPGFEHHCFVARKKDGKYAMQEEVERIAEHLLREERRTMGDRTPKPDVHLAQADEFITTASTTVHIERGKFPFDQDGLEGLFAAMGTAEDDFRGAVEIEKTSRQLNRLYPEDIERAFGVDELVDRVRRILFTEAPSAAVLVGPRGAGKSAIVHEALARHLTEHGTFEKIPKVWHLDPNRVIAGMRIVGQWERRFESILEHARDRIRLQHKEEGRDVLFIDNLVAMLRVGKSAGSDLTLADVLKPFLEKRELPFLAEATPEAWKTVQEMNRAFTDLFQVVRVPEPPRELAVRILARQRAQIERRTGVSIENEALARLVDLQRSFPQETAMPGCAVEVLREIASKQKGGAIGVIQIDAAFQGASRLSSRVFMPEVKLGDADVREHINARLIGQAEATQSLTEVVHLAKARLNRAEKPLAAMLFVGPTGVGKTEAAKALASYLLEDEDCFLRFDMNEYIDDDAAARLIGDPLQPEGQLTNRVRHRPFCVLLFDEIEKAHPSVHDLLLQVLGEGRLTDSLGRTVDFANAIIVMTSNLGAGDAARTVGFGRSDASQAAAYRKAVEEFFRPEFVNRIDRIVAFQPLGLDDVKRIARLQIERLLARDGFVRRSTSLNVREAALDEIARRGFDKEMGGRALKRAIERELTWMTAEALVSMPPSDPVIFEIHLRDGRLAPRVVAMPLLRERVEPVEMTPPEDGSLRAFFEELEADVDVVEAELASSRPPGAPDPDYLILKDRAYELKKQVGDLIAELPRGDTTAANFMFKWKGRERAYTLARPDGLDPNDLFAQMDIRDYLEEKFRGVKKEVSGARAVALETRAAVAALAIQHGAFKAGRRGGFCLHLRSCVEGGGTFEVAELVERYHRLLKAIDPHFEHFPGFPDPERPSASLKPQVWLFGGEPGFFDLLKPETGIHLFLEPYGKGLPVQARVLAVPEGADPSTFVEDESRRYEAWRAAFERGEAAGEDPWTPGSVVRIYSKPGGGQDGTIADLRTGTMERFFAPPMSWFAWAFSALKGGA